MQNTRNNGKIEIMKKLICITITINLLVSTVKAQQLPLSSLYNVNKFQINSAYAGFNGCLEGYLSHRSQWVGLNGAPTTQYLSLHSGVGKNMGLGANIVYDKTDIISKFSGSLSYAYRVKLGQEHNLRFGFSLGLYQVNINPFNAIIEDISDEIIVSGNQASKAFNNEFSLYYNYKKLELGVSIPQIVETNASFNLTSNDGSFGLKRHVISTLSYDVSLSEKLSFQPSLLYKTFNGTQNQLDINGQITYNKLISIGVGYRTEAGLLARFGLTIQDLFMVGYAYEFTSSDISLAASGSHEIMLGIKFCKDKDKKIVPIVEPEPIVEEKKIEEIIEEIKPVIEKVVIEKKEEEFDKSVFNVKVQFPLNNNEIDNSFNEPLDRIVKTMKDNPNLKINIIGHSCDLGSTQIKEKIANQRAENVKAYLTRKGIDATRISPKGASDSQQIAPNTSEANRQKNRRVVFILIK